jgi:DNA-directed RNA polymerase subunit RPC12/RpoP
MIRTMLGREPLESFNAGTLAGAGSFRCEECGFAVALHERDEVPACPHCGGKEFKRSSIFGDLNVPPDPVAMHDSGPPTWLAEAREAIDRDGDYLAFEDGKLRVVALADGWTRIGRSLSADIRFDDPTVSRRHAMIHVDGENVRILDDRSLNGVFVNGARVDMRPLADGDLLTIGRFDLYFMVLHGTGHRARRRRRGAVA